MKRRSLVKQLEGLGAEVRVTRRNHLLVSVGGQVVTTIGSTPSDRRSDMNARAQLRRAGIKL